MPNERKNTSKPGRSFLPDTGRRRPEAPGQGLSADQLVQTQFPLRQRSSVRSQLGTRVLWVEGDVSQPAK